MERPFDQAEIEVFKDLTIRDESNADKFPKSAFIEVPTDRKPGPVMSAETIRAGLKSHDKSASTSRVVGFAIPTSCSVPMTIIT